MEEQSRPRRGRPRKVVDVPATAEQAESQPNQHDGNGEAGAVGNGAQVRVAPPDDWSVYASRVIARQMSVGDVRTIWHPVPPTDILLTDNGNIRVLMGVQKAQLADASFIEL